MPKRNLLVLCLGSLLLMGALSCGGQPGESGGAAPQAPHFEPGINLFSPQQDVELGQRSAAQIAREMPLLRDEMIVGYIRQLGAKLAAKAPGEKFPYTFNVVATKDINAFALPGGFIFVNAGTIAAARNEGELAGVMSHEIMHVALRHGTNQATKAYIAQAGLGVLTSVLAGGDNPDMAGIMQTIGGAGANMLFLKFGRTAEKQSDLQGARIMAEAGYDPRDMANFFRTLQQAGGQGVPEFLSDHPDPGNRIASIEQIYASLPVSQNPIRESEAFEQAKSRLTGRPITASKRLARIGPSDPNDIEPGARPQPPSANFRAFQANDGSFALEFPDNWRALSADQSNYIFAPEGAYAQSAHGGGSILVTHGIFIGVVPPLGRDLGSATAAFVQKQIESNPDFRLQQQPQPVNFGGQLGYITVIAGPSTTTGVQEIDTTYTTATADGRLFYLITIAPEDEMSQYRAAFERLIGSLRLAR